MKIRKVKWANHPILGNLELNFINPTTNKPYSTINGLPPPRSEMTAALLIKEHITSV